MQVKYTSKAYILTATKYVVVQLEQVYRGNNSLCLKFLPDKFYLLTINCQYHSNIVEERKRSPLETARGGIKVNRDGHCRWKCVSTCKSDKGMCRARCMYVCRWIGLKEGIEMQQKGW